MKKAWGLAIACALAFACSHFRGGPAKVDPQEVGEGFRAAYVKSLESRPGTKVREFEIESIEPSESTGSLDPSLKIRYRSVYDDGEAEQRIRAEAVLERDPSDPSHWKVRSLEPRAQEVIFRLGSEVSL